MQQLLQARLENLAVDPAGAGLVAGRVWFNTTDLCAKAYDGNKVQAFGWARRYGLLTADFPFSGITLQDIAGLSFDILNGEQWIFEARIHTVSLNATADLRFNVTGAANGIFTATNPENAVSKTGAIGTATTNIPVVTSTGVNADMLIVSGRLTATADTTIQVQVRNNTGNTVQTFSQYSYLVADFIK